MISFILAIVSILAITAPYLLGSSTWVLTYTRILAITATITLAGEISLGAGTIIWDYMVANSFCPWIMIFRGRPSMVIISEAANHAHNLIHYTSITSIFNSLSGLSSTAAELIGGPALGIILTAIFIFITYKCAAVAFGKLFNRK